MANVAMARYMTEDELLTAIVEAAQMFGWLVHHDRRSDRALQMGAPGFPDLVMAKKGRLMMLELKAEKGVVSPAQLAWALALPDLVRVVRPTELDAIIRELME